ASHVKALTSAQAGALNSVQVAAMSSDTLQALETQDLRALRTAAISVLGSAQVSSLSGNQFGALTTGQLAALNTGAIAAIGSSQLAGMSSQQVAGMASAQFLSLSSAAIAGLSSLLVPVLRTATIAAMSSGQIGAFTENQIVALSSGQASALTAGQIVALSTDDVRAMQSADMQALSTSTFAAMTTSQFAAMTEQQIVGLSTAQIHAMNSSQLHAWSTDQQAAMTSAQVAALDGFLTPIMLDLDGNGVMTTSIRAGTRFDLDADGRSDNTGWVDKADGLLVRDRNGDGVINDGSELFGSAVTLADGSKARDGYQALRELDSNGDGTLDARDTGFTQLKVWVDADGDGISQTGEVRVLGEAGIASLSLNAAQTDIDSNGNRIGLVSSYQTADGKSHQMADVWFATNAAGANLRSTVSGLTQAMAAFGNLPPALPADSPLTLQPDAKSSAALTVSAMADTIRRFEATTQLSSATAAPTDSPEQHALRRHATGFLAAPK
ncbi:heme utilization protein, partial [Massilia sp. SM-13]